MTKEIKLKSKSAIIVMLILTVVLFTFPKIEAGSKIIIVPKDYSTIQEAVSNAADGDTVLVKNGFYLVDENSTIVINKTLSLIGEDPANTIILGASTTYSENGIAIRLAAPNIVISGVTITKFKVAIAVVNYKAEQYPSGCKIINNNIVNNSEGIRQQRNDLLISENNITQNYVGIAGYNTENILVTRNNISTNWYGIDIGVCRNITVSENQISDNTGGLILYYYGPHFVYSNNITNNNWGIKFAEGCNNAIVYGNRILQNDVGVVLLIFPNAGDVIASGDGNMVFGNFFVDNNKQVTQEKNSNYPDVSIMGTDIVSWDNGTIGNHWDDYSGLDENEDGIGDIPYIIDENNRDNNPLKHSWFPTTTLELQPSGAFPATLVIASVATITTVSIGLLVYLKKRKR
jgi:nitrous oxidase accessory protein